MGNSANPVASSSNPTTSLPPGFTLDDSAQSVAPVTVPASATTPQKTPAQAASASGPSLPAGFQLDPADSNAPATTPATTGAPSNAATQLNPPSFASTLPPMTIQAAPKSTGAMDSLEGWFRDAANDLKYGTGKTEVGRILKKMGAQPLADETTEGEQAAMPTSIVTGALHTGEGLTQILQHEKRIQGLETTLKGILEAITVPSQLVGGGELGETPMLEKSLDEGANLAAKGSEAAGNVASKAGDVIRAAQKGDKIAQPAAQTALRTATGMTGDSLRTGLEQPIADLKSQAKSLYKAFDDASGVDYRDLQSQLSDTEFKAKQAADPDIEARYADKASAIRDKIEQAKSAAAAKGVDLKTLDKADALFKHASALSDLQRKLAPAIIGDATKGAPESVNIGSAIKALQRMDANAKYGSSRLVQAIGSREAADSLLRDLYAAQKTGQQAMKVQKFAKLVSKWVGAGIGLGAGYHVAHGLLSGE